MWAWIEPVLKFVPSIVRLGHRVLRLRSVSRFLDDLADEQKTLSVFIREMEAKCERTGDTAYANCPDKGRYYSESPRGQVGFWKNIGLLVASADVETAGDILNLVGQAGRVGNIAWRQVKRDGEIWSQPIVSIGGHYKSTTILQVCTPALVVQTGSGFSTMADNEQFTPNCDHDYALIYRGRHETGNSCLAVFGGGRAGTRAAGSFLRRKAHDLARLYGKRGFAAIIRVGWHVDQDSGVVAWLSPPSPRAPWLHFWTWRRYRGAFTPKRGPRAP